MRLSHWGSGLCHERKWRGAPRWRSPHDRNWPDIGTCYVIVSITNNTNNSNNNDSNVNNNNNTAYNNNDNHINHNNNHANNTTNNNISICLQLCLCPRLYQRAAFASSNRFQAIALNSCNGNFDIGNGNFDFRQWQFRYRPDRVKTHAGMHTGAHARRRQTRTGHALERAAQSRDIPPPNPSAPHTPWVRSAQVRA